MSLRITTMRCLPLENRQIVYMTYKVFDFVLLQLTEIAGTSEWNNRKYEGDMRAREEKFVDLWHPILQETGERRQTKSAGPNCEIIDFETIRLWNH